MKIIKKIGCSCLCSGNYTKVANGVLFSLEAVAVSQKS